MPYFRIENDIFLLRLDPYEFQVYAYLVSCAGKKGECWPSTNTIARALGMSQSTVISKIDSLVRRQLIDREATTRHSKSGKVSTANNHYHIRSVAEAKMAHECFLGVHHDTPGTLTDEEDI
jgi:predicted transcriptional regulator